MSSFRILRWAAVSFCLLTERKAYRENNPALLEYVKSHSKFFVLAGPGLWRGERRGHLVEHRRW